MVKHNLSSKPPPLEVETEVVWLSILAWAIGRDPVSALTLPYKQAKNKTNHTLLQALSGWLFKYLNMAEHTGLKSGSSCGWAGWAQNTCQLPASWFAWKVIISADYHRFPFASLSIILHGCCYLFSQLRSTLISAPEFPELGVIGAV